MRPGVWFSDLGEFAIRPAFLSVGHYPGYPVLNQLYYLPHLVDVAPAHLAGALNALIAAAAVAALYAAWRVLGARAAAAAPLALAFAFAPAYWNTATVGPDAHALEIFTLAVVIALSGAAARRADFRYHLAAAFVFALALANRTSSAFVAFWLAPTFFGAPRRRLYPTLAIFALGFSTYLFLAFRMNAFADLVGQPKTGTFKDCVQYIVGFSTHGGVPLALPKEHPVFRFLAGNIIFEAQYGILALAAMGLVSFFHKKKQAVLGVGLVACGAGFFGLFVIYVSGASEPYVLAPLAFVFTFAAFGAEAAWRLGGRRRITTAALALALAAIPAYNLVRNFRLANHRTDHGVDTFVVESLRSMVYESGVAGEHSNFMPFLYYRFGRAARPDQTYYSVNVDSWRDGMKNVTAGAYGRFAEYNSARPRRRTPRKTYAVTPYPGIRTEEAYTPSNVEGAWLARCVARLARGEHFVAVVADATPTALRRPKGEDDWETFIWSQDSSRFRLEDKKACATFLAGVRTGGKIRFYAAVRRGGGQRRFSCPREFRSPPQEDITFAFAGDAVTGLTAVSLGIGDRRYALATSGAIFVPLDATWRPTGNACYFRGGRYRYDIFESYGAPRVQTGE